MPLTEATQFTSTSSLSSILSVSQMTGAIAICFVIMQNCVFIAWILKCVNEGYIGGRSDVERFGIGIFGVGAPVGVLLVNMLGASRLLFFPAQGPCLAFYHARKLNKWGMPPVSNFVFWYNGDFEVQAALSAKKYRQYIKEECQDIQEIMLMYSKCPELYM